MDIKADIATASVAEAIHELLDALAAVLPALAPALQHTRLVFDTREQAMLVCPILADGSSQALLAIRCDPEDPASFGVVGIPMSVKGMYSPTGPVH